MPAPPPSPSPRALALLLPFALYLLGALALGGWIIDDAGISFAYARNLAHGHGLVAQPGRAPVEGFSDFLWVVLLVPSFWLRLFHPVVTPKVIGALAVLLGFALVQRTLLRRGWGLVPGIAVTTLAALSPPIVIWSASGLENGLFFLLTAALFSIVVLRPRRWQLGAGALAALLAMTRPDGLVFAPAGALLCVGEAIAQRRARRAMAASTGRYLAAFAALAAPFFAYRLAVFHLAWPHPYYAKTGFLTLADRLRFFSQQPEALWAKITDLGSAVAGPLGPWPLFAVLAVTAVLAARRRLPFELWVATVLWLSAAAAFILIDEDWMGERRFATAALLTSILAAVLAVHAALPRSRRAVTVGWALAAALWLFEYTPRMWRFASNPPTPYADVVREARRFDAYAEALGLGRGSILTADIGGALMESRLTVFDAAGLCEPAVVRTLKQGTATWSYDHPEFYDWVLDTVRPTFVTTHQFWSNVTALGHDPRFARDYAAINAHDDAYVARVYGRHVRSGDFVRRDALRDAGALDRLRAIHAPDARPDPLLVRIAERLGVGPVPAPDAPVGDLQAAARLARTRDDPDRAATLLARAVDRSGAPDRGTLLALADALDDAGRCDEARPVWQRILDLAAAQRDDELRGHAAMRLSDPPPESPAQQQILMARGLRELYEEGRTGAAIETFQQVLALNAGHYGATYQTAVAFERAGRREAAQAWWAKVLPLAESFGDPKTAAEARARLGRP